jgi:hypothetical protein
MSGDAMRMTRRRCKGVLQPLKRFLGVALLLVLLVVLVFVAIRLNRPPRTDYEAELFQGVTYVRQARSTPRPLMIHIVEIDLSSPRIGLLVTPSDGTGGMDLSARTTSAFLAEFGLQVAINGGFFEPFHAQTPWDYYPHSGDPVDVKGLAISNGETYSDDNAQLPVLCISADHAQIRHAGCLTDTFQALAGDRIFVADGVPVVPHHSAYHSNLNPRTAVAVGAQGKMLWLIVVDGRQRNYSEGVAIGELADIVLELGAETALNLDGGGSSTLVMAGHWGPRALNAPFHTRIPMRQRSVANHLGVYALPLEENVD